MSSMFGATSWLSNAKRRAKEGLMQAMGSPSETSASDLEFETKLRNFNTHVHDLQKLKQAMEVWLDSFEVFCTSTQILCENWRNFHSSSPYTAGDCGVGHSALPGTSAAAANANSSLPEGMISPFQNVSCELDKVMTEIHLHLQPAVHDIFKNRCMKPINFILSMVPQINEQILQRKTVLLDFDSVSSKIKKDFEAGRDSSNPSVAKKKVRLNESATKLYALQTSLTRTLDEFEVARPLTLGPELAAFSACIYSFSASIYHSTSTLLPYIPQSVSTLAILDTQVMSSKSFTDRLTKSTDRSSQLTSTLGLTQRDWSIVEPITLRPQCMGGGTGGYGESLQVVQSSMRLSTRAAVALPTEDSSENAGVASLSTIEEESSGNTTPTRSVDSRRWDMSEVNRELDTHASPPPKPPRTRPQPERHGIDEAEHGVDLS